MTPQQLLEDAARALGDTPERVVAALAAHDISVDAGGSNARRRCRTCPIATYLRQRTGLIAVADAFVLELYDERGACVAEMQTPPGVADFVELVDEAWIANHHRPFQLATICEVRPPVEVARGMVEPQ